MHLILLRKQRRTKQRLRFISIWQIEKKPVNGSSSGEEFFFKFSLPKPQNERKVPIESFKNETHITVKYIGILHCRLKSNI